MDGLLLFYTHIAVFISVGALPCRIPTISELSARVAPLQRLSNRARGGLFRVHFEAS